MPARHAQPSIARLALVPSVVLPVTAADGRDATLPDTVVGRRARAFLDAYDGGDPEATRAFVTEQCADELREQAPLHRLVAQMTAMRDAVAISGTCAGCGARKER